MFSEIWSKENSESEYEFGRRNLELPDVMLYESDHPCAATVTSKSHKSRIAVPFSLRNLVICRDSSSENASSAIIRQVLLKARGS